ncbi:cell cycle control protein [Grosmannia clavigera kw1407]|uniref:Cell cycle control protein n=1 Tax=Grosmannia clavigera (strain kw1407 / UAMH 11150) TaxID=655863 RepID=F0XIV4_GROCL|nr:cell cycle control protein [Grosmannia clavigera kw1407]EFX02383.1 cell cycle control protein [Grosmannia clavigera kw1407]
MSNPSALRIDYIHRRTKEQLPSQKKDAQYQVSERELNKETLQQLNDGKVIDELRTPANSAESYCFGDEASQWRMTKLRAVYTVAGQSDRPVDEVAIERYGSLREFDEAREEEKELERRRLYGKGYVVKEKPTGDLYQERMERSPKPTIRDENAGRSPSPRRPDEVEVQRPPEIVDQTTLNRLRAQLMKAKLKNSPNVERLETEFNQAMATSSAANKNGVEHAVVIDPAYNRMLASTRNEVKAVETRRGRERGQVVANDDMSIDDMMREERRTRGAAGGEGLRLAERITKDAKFKNDLEYMDDNAEKLASRTHKSEATLKNIAVNDFTKMNKILDSCPLCHHEDRRPPQNLPTAPIVSLATRVFLTLPTEPELTGADGGAVIVPVEHHTNLLDCDNDEWEEIRNFMKSLTRLYHDQGRDIVFYENAASPHRRMHAALIAVPIPYDLGATAPAFFKDAMLSADEEWSQHKKLIDTGKRAREGLGKQAFRKSIAKEMPYFHVWFTVDGGLGHIVEDAGRWPKGDLFAREIIGGMLDVDASIIRRQGRWTRDDARLGDFQKRWRKFDWTRILTEEQQI